MTAGSEGRRRGHRSPLFGRRVHIAGSIAHDLGTASTDDVRQARALVQALVRELVAAGATFVVPVDAEKCRADDGEPVCFDWLIWESLHASLARRPAGAPNPLVIAVQHHKTEEQIPAQYERLWDELRGSDLVQIDNVAHWNMNSKRMEAAARWGDILIAVGGSEGVLFLANLYHEAGKPVIPLNLPVGPRESGARRIFEIGLSSSRAARLFRAVTQDEHTWVNRINFTRRHGVEERVVSIRQLLEDLDPPRAFVVRMLNPDLPDYADVQEFFDSVAYPVIEDELGYEVTVVDGQQAFEYPRMDQEIFEKLHRSRAVFADLTGSRPNCYLELGYALGRSLPTMVTAKKGFQHPFDITTLSAHHWEVTGALADRRRAFHEHWETVRNRPPLVTVEPLIP